MAYDTFAQALLINEDQDIRRTVEKAGDADWFKVKFAKAGNANFYLEPQQSNLQLDLRIYDANNNLLKTSTNAAGVHELITMAVKASTYYYVRVNHSGTYSSSHSYLLRCKNYPASGTEVDFDDAYYINQGDANFKDIPFKNGTKVGPYGCGVCSFAMLVCRDQGITTVSGKQKIIKEIIANATNANGDLTYTFGAINGKTYTHTNGVDIEAELKKGRPVVAQVPGHYVVVYAIDDSKTGNAKYLVKDPGKKSNTHLQQVMNDYNTSTIKSKRVLYR